MKKNTNRFYYIVACNYHQFHNYLIENKIDRNDARLVDRAEKLYGMYPDINDIIFIGQYWLNPNIKEIKDRIAIIKSRQ